MKVEKVLPNMILSEIFYVEFGNHIIDYFLSIVMLFIAVSYDITTFYLYKNTYFCIITIYFYVIFY